ncbi:ImmA/IrrE family metallo-endopeptidase [Dyella choica]|uniref:ImmA/IrrE family metallo-endopeptidase n=1 Tax=Dyella choica TaxID=1927959 RepID=A0A432M0R7_9GAMM|nr:ImmA/IrrE family metallo-endopeptidase [Dyella choica]RUL70521.1 ImmA/IrrE family metallo-endopeptidase [Dyella choica]
MLEFKTKAAQIAVEVLRDTGAERRIHEDGYTRVDPLWIAAMQGVMVMRRPFEKLLGAFVRESTPGIIINSDRPTGLIHLTCAHELGHYFLGHESTADEHIQYDKDAALQEREADWFAYCLLTSRGVLAQTMRRKGWSIAALRDPLNLYQLSLRIGVSYAAMAWSLARLKLWASSDADRMTRTEPAEIKRSILSRGDFEARNDVWLLDERDRELILEPSVRDQIVVRLPNHAPSGYLWSLDEAHSEGFRIQPLDTSARPAAAEPPSTTNAEADHLLIGHTERGKFAGQILPLIFTEKRPWESKSEDEARFRTSVGFEEAGEGLSAGSRRRLLQEGAPAA